MIHSATAVQDKQTFLPLQTAASSIRAGLGRELSASDNTSNLSSDPQQNSQL